MDSTSYDIALVLHLLGALAFVAGIVLAGVAFEAARRRQRPAEIALLLSLTRFGVLLLAIGTLLIAAFGLWLAPLGHRRRPLRHVRAQGGASRARAGADPAGGIRDALPGVHRAAVGGSRRLIASARSRVERSALLQPAQQQVEVEHPGVAAPARQRGDWILVET